MQDAMVHDDYALLNGFGLFPVLQSRTGDRRID